MSLDHVERVVAANGAIEQICCVWEEHAKKLGLFVKLEQSKADDQHFLRVLKFYLMKHLHPSSIPDVIMKLKSFPLSRHGELHLYQSGGTCQHVIAFIPVSQVSDTFYFFGITA